MKQLRVFKNGQWVATGGSQATDLSAYAKREDKEQWLLARTVTAQGYGFGDTLIPNVAITYTDTGEGYGSRLVLALGDNLEYLVLKSDLEPLNQLLPKIEALENAPPVDTSAFVTQAWVAANCANKDDVYTESEADALFALKTATYGKTECDGLFATKATTYTRTEVDGKIPSLTAYAKTVDVYTKTQADTQFAPKATTYTKVEVDGKIPSLTAYAKTADVYTKAEVDGKIPSLADYAKTANVPAVGAWLGAVPQSGSTGTVGSRMIGTDMVQLVGSITFAGPLASNQWTDIALLQSAARPAKDSNFVAVAMDGTGTPNLVSIWVYATGKVTVRNYAAITSVQFNHILASR